MTIRELAFYILAIRIMFTFEKSCKDTKKYNINQINLQIYDMDNA